MLPLSWGWRCLTQRHCKRVPQDPTSQLNPSRLFEQNWAYNLRGVSKSKGEVITKILSYPDTMTRSTVGIHWKDQAERPDHCEDIRQASQSLETHERSGRQLQQWERPKVTSRQASWLVYSVGLNLESSMCCRHPFERNSPLYIVCRKSDRKNVSRRISKSRTRDWKSWRVGVNIPACSIPAVIVIRIPPDDIGL